MILIDNKWVENLSNRLFGSSFCLGISKEVFLDSVNYEFEYESFKIISNNHYRPVLIIYPIDNTEYLHLYKEISNENKYNLFKELKRLYEKTEDFRQKLSFIPKEEIEERLIEFDVINDGYIDMISLRSLYDFYNQKFIYSM